MPIMMKTKEQAISTDNQNDKRLRGRADGSAQAVKGESRFQAAAKPAMKTDHLADAERQLKNAERFSRSQNAEIRRIQQVVKQKTKERNKAQQLLEQTQDKQQHATAAAVKEAAQQAMSQNNKVVDDQQQVLSAQVAAKAAAKAVTKAQNAVQLAEVEFNKQQQVVDVADRHLQDVRAAVSQHASADESERRAIAAAQDKIQDAKQAMAEAQADYQNKQQAYSATSAAVEKVQTTIKNAKESLSAAHLEAQKAERQAASASAALSLSQEKVVQTSAAMAKHQQVYQAAVQADSAGQLNLRQKLEKAQDRLAKSRDQVNAQAAAVKKLQARAQAAATAKSKARAEVEASSKAEQQAQQELNSLQQAYDRVNHDDLPTNLPHFSFSEAQKQAAQDYLGQLVNLVKADQFEADQLKDLPAYKTWAQTMKLSAADDPERGLTALYHNWEDEDAHDQQVQLDLGQLSAQQGRELSVFTAHVLNQLRQALGISQVVGRAVATDGMASLAQEVAELAQTKPSYATEDGHYLYALHQAAYDHGMANEAATDDEKIISDQPYYGENLGTLSSLTLNEHLTLADAKDEIVRTIAEILCGKRRPNFASVNAIIGALSLPAGVHGGHQSYVGTSISYSPHVMVNGEAIAAHQVHLMIYEGYQVASYQKDQDYGPTNLVRQAKVGLTRDVNAAKRSKDDEAFDKTAIDAINQAKKDLLHHQSATKAAKEELENAVVSYGITTKLVKQGKAKLANLQSQLADDQNTERAVAQLTNRSDDQSVVAAAKDSLARAKAASRAAKDALAARKQDYYDAKENIVKKKQLIPQAEKAVNESTKGLKLKQFKSYVAVQNYQLAKTALKKAQGQLSESQQNYSTIINRISNGQLQQKQLIRQAVSQLLDAQIKLSQLQSAVLKTNVALRDAQNHQLQCGKKLTAAQKQVTQDLGKVKNLNGRYQQLTEAAKAVEVVQRGLAQKQADLDHAEQALQQSRAVNKRIEDNLRRAQDRVQTLTTSLQEASQPQAVSQAQSRHLMGKVAVMPTEAQPEAAAQAPASDAERYGKYIEIACVTTHEGDALPKPTIANGFTSADHDNQLTLVGDRGYSVKVVAGTTAQWLNQEKVAQDAAVKGDYNEYVLVSFPDQSTYKTWGRLNVLGRG